MGTKIIHDMKAFWDRKAEISDYNYPRTIAMTMDLCILLVIVAIGRTVILIVTGN